MTTTLSSGASRRRKAVLGSTALGSAAVLAFAGPVTSALGASSIGAPVVSTSESVKAELDANGKLDVARLFSQIQATGNGHVSLVDPTSTKNLRNLDGWGAPDTKGGNAVYDFTVDGKKQFRTVADFTKRLPVSVRVSYTLNGRPIKSGDLAGKSGKLGVNYDIKNITAEPTQITYEDGFGKQQTETIDLVTPYVGQLVLDLPSSFSNIATTDNRADQAGDGHGGRQVNWTMVLFEPIGQVEQKLGFTADVKDLALPKAQMQIVPVSPENHPELKFGQDGFQSGAATGQSITDGGVQLTAGTVKLRNGASQLLAGLTQLQAGAVQLNSGLSSGVPQLVSGGQQLSSGATTAADGSEQVAAGAKKVAAGNRQLANGLGALAGGAGQLQTGAKKLSSGADQLSTGFQDPNSENDLIDGSQNLAAALGLISGGLAQLNSASTGLPAAKAGAIALQIGLNQILAGIGTPTTPNTILWGLDQLSTGNTQLRAGVKQLQDGNAALQAGIGTPTTPNTILWGLAQLASPGGLPAAKGGVDQVKAGLDDALVPTTGSIDRLIGGVMMAKLTAGCSGDAVCLGTLNAVLQGLSGTPDSLKEQTQLASGGLGQVSAGLASAIAALGSSAQPTTIIGGVTQVAGGLTQSGAGLAQVAAGLDQSGAGLAQVTAGVNAVKAGLKSGSTAQPGIYEGLAQLVAGLTTAVNGVGQLAPGAAAANTGAGDLADGIATAGDGAAQLASGAAQLSGGLDQVAAQVPDAVSGAQALAKGSAALADGSATLAAGLSGQLAPGAKKLSDGLAGLQGAVDGSAQIADGMGQAVTGNKKLVAGTTLLTQGTKQLAQSGNEGASTYGKEYATMLALNVKGTKGLPYGEPRIRFGKSSALALGSTGVATAVNTSGSSDNRGAYDISIAAVGSPSAMGNAGRGIVGLVVLALGALAATLIRGRRA